MAVTESAQRVTRYTSAQAGCRIQAQTIRRLRYYADHPDEIARRLRELDREWDIERVLETSSSTLTLAGLALGIGVHRKWLCLSLAVQGFFLMHAINGWCPPVPVLRSLGVRTPHEIEEERYALKVIRGDIQDATTANTLLASLRKD